MSTESDSELSFRALERAIKRSEGLAILFAVCDGYPARKRWQDRLAADLPDHPAGEVRIGEAFPLVDAVTTAAPGAGFISISGLELDSGDAPKRRDLAQELNASRPRWREQIHKAVVFWLSEDFLTVLEQDAPDFYNWRRGIFFLNETAEVVPEGLSIGDSRSFADTVGNSATADPLSPEARHRRIAILEERLARPESLDADVGALRLRGDWAAELGETLLQAGEVERAIREFTAARTAYQLALQKISSNSEPLLWAEIHADLASCLHDIGSISVDPQFLEAAVAAYREALRDRGQLDRARAQNNLGRALSELGERKGRTERLEEAVVAFREALSEYSTNDEPLHLAATHNNLGIALGRIGERERGTGRLEEAVAAFREALKVRTRERAPLDWAGTQSNLGLALFHLGERESGTGRLEEAVAAFREALKENKREWVPLAWAGTQNNLGLALFRLGQRESGTGRLEEAVAAYREAMKEYTRERVPLDWAMLQSNLSVALSSIGERESGTRQLEEALAASREVLKVRIREHVPLDWAATHYNLAVILYIMGVREGNSPVRLAEAERTCLAALEVFAGPALEYYRAKAEKLLAEIHEALRKLD